MPTARTWFGYTSVQTYALVANREKTLDAVKLAKALGNFELPAEVKLQPNKCYYRAGDHQLMTSSFVGEALTKPAGDPEDLFRVNQVLAGDKVNPRRATPAAACSGPPNLKSSVHRARGASLPGCAIFYVDLPGRVVGPCCNSCCSTSRTG